MKALFLGNASECACQSSKHAANAPHKDLQRVVKDVYKHSSLFRFIVYCVKPTVKWGSLSLKSSLSHHHLFVEGHGLNSALYTLHQDHFMDHVSVQEGSLLDTYPNCSPQVGCASNIHPNELQTARRPKLSKHRTSRQRSA